MASTGSTEPPLASVRSTAELVGASRRSPSPGVGILREPLLTVAPLCVYAVRQGDMATGLNGRMQLYCFSAGLGLIVGAQAVFAGFRPRGSRWFTRLVALVAQPALITARDAEPWSGVRLARFHRQVFNQ